MASEPITRIKTCKQCGKNYFWVRGAMGELRGSCSLECTKERMRVRAANVRSSGYVAPSRIPKIKSDPTPCEWCGTLTTRPRFCSTKCSHDKSKGVSPRHQTSCKECGGHMEVSGNKRKFCSSTCEKKHRWRKSTVIRRARMRDCARERFDPNEVFTRDKWRCHICGIRTPRGLRGTLSPCAPELDHIIPLAAGGDHTKKNTACSCRRCNQLKRDKPLGQLLLIG